MTKRGRPSKPKAVTQPNLVEVPKPDQAPSPFEAKCESAKMLVTLQTLLVRGSFNIADHQLLIKSIQFCKILHQQLIDEIVEFPEADSVPELKELKDKKKGLEHV